MLVFFDLVQACVTTWKYGILRDLLEANIRVRLPDFQSKFVNVICFLVRVSSCLSDIIRSGNWNASSLAADVKI